VGSTCHEGEVTCGIHLGEVIYDIIEDIFVMLVVRYSEQMLTNPEHAIRV
jgi:hypothetical protein